MTSLLYFASGWNEDTMLTQFFNGLPAPDYCLIFRIFTEIDIETFRPFMI
jgi:hypothetical protein